MTTQIEICIGLQDLVILLRRLKSYKIDIIRVVQNPDYSIDVVLESQLITEMEKFKGDYGHLYSEKK